MASSLSSSLLGLPDELLLHILVHVDGLAHPYRTRSLYALSMTSRHLHGITKPYLYSTFSFHTGVPYKFLRTIRLNSDLASQVKVIRWDYDSSQPERFYHEPGKLAVKQKWQLDDVYDQLAHMAAQENQIAESLMMHLKLGHLYLGSQRVLDLLLMFSPNVEHLEVVETYRWDDHTFWFSPIVPLVDEVNDFSRLTSATIHGPMRVPNVFLLMFIPTLRRLELSQVIEMRQETDQPLPWEESEGGFIDLIFCGSSIGDPPSSNLEDLCILESYIDLDDVTRLVSLTRNLKTFVYEHERNDLSIQHVEFPQENLNQLLQYHRLSLTSIRFAHRDAALPFHPPPLSGHPPRENLLFENFQDFPNLAHLELYFPLSTWDNLPPNIEHLTIDHHGAHYYYETPLDTSDLEKSIADLAAHKQRGELPNLRMLAFKNWHPFYGTFPQDMSIKRVLEDVGIQFSSLPAKIGSSMATREDLVWVELQTEPEWVMVEKYHLDYEY